MLWPPCSWITGAYQSPSHSGTVVRIARTVMLTFLGKEQHLILLSLLTSIHFILLFHFIYISGGRHTPFCGSVVTPRPSAMSDNMANMEHVVGKCGVSCSKAFHGS
uniref:Uncharacterized protein n=1 Tax=Qingyuan Parti tick virus 1 TaxID=2972280 RepID=A0A9E7V257_9VIRU|nr:MAG: hypothetical protein [Qingyuan Parti tick virus 1]